MIPLAAASPSAEPVVVPRVVAYPACMDTGTAFELFDRPVDPVDRLLRRRLDDILAEATGQTVERIHHDTDRDTWFSAEEAVAYGLIDEVSK